MSQEASSEIDIKSLTNEQLLGLVMKITRTESTSEMIQVLEGWSDLEVHVITLKNELESAISILKGIEQEKIA